MLGVLFLTIFVKIGALLGPLLLWIQNVQSDPGSWYTMAVRPVDGVGLPMATRKR